MNTLESYPKVAYVPRLASGTFTSKHARVWYLTAEYKGTSATIEHVYGQSIFDTEARAIAEARTAYERELFRLRRQSLIAAQRGAYAP